MTQKDAINLAMDVIFKTEKKKHGKIVDIAVVKEGKFRILTEDEIKKQS